MACATRLVGLMGLLATLACGRVASDNTDGGPPMAGQTGALCTSDGECDSTHCVDHRCCLTTCTGQCEACDVALEAGTCTPVAGAPHGDREVCAGDGVCAGACDGVASDVCSFPTSECRAESCVGTTHTAPSTCATGACPSEVVDTCPVACGATTCVTAEQVSAGYYDGCAVLSDKTVRCWGSDTGGQLGDMNANGLRPSPVPGVTNAVAVTTANAHACALLADATAVCWGSNSFGELGRGAADTMAHYEAMPVLNEAGTGPLAGIQSIVAGQFRTCALVKVGFDTEARCWGFGSSGALGNGGVADAALPQPVCTAGSVAAGNCTHANSVAQIATGREHTCARFNGGAMGCWGANYAGQLAFFTGGAYTKDVNPHPNVLFVRDPGNTATNLQVSRIATAIGETGDSTCAIRKNDQVLVCWGTNLKGQLGRASFTNPLPGQEIPSPVCTTATGCQPLTGASDIGIGYQHACAIVVDKVRCWGSNARGQLGDQTLTDKSFSAFEVPTAERASQLAVGEFHTCARLLDGRVQCWGIGGSLGAEEAGDTPMPVFPHW